MPSTIAALLSRLRELDHADDMNKLATLLREKAIGEADVYLHLLGPEQLCEVLHAAVLSGRPPAAGDSRHGGAAHTLVSRILSILSHEGGRAVLSHAGIASLAKLAVCIKALEDRKGTPTGLNVTSSEVSDVAFASKVHDIAPQSVAQSDDLELLEISKALAVAVTVPQRERMGPGDLANVIEVLRTQAKAYNDTLLSKCLHELMDSPA